MNKKTITILCVSLLLGAALCLAAVFLLRNKSPEAYSWDEYLAMSHEEQDAFFEQFDTVDQFEAWKESAQPKETQPDFRWNEPGKLPNAYTWEEYVALTLEQKEAFYLWFESAAAFESWKEQAEPEESPDPNPVWEEEDRLPEDYTWEEYQSLSLEQQDAFFQWFPSKEAFDRWMVAAKPQESAPSWNDTGKKPTDYTWEEYQSLTPEEQDAFYLWFETMKDFEAWMDAAQPEKNAPENAEWNKPGKKPDEYTMEEYQVLTPEEQELFYQWFPSKEAFEAWLNRVEQE